MSELLKAAFEAAKRQEKMLANVSFTDTIVTDLTTLGQKLPVPCSKALKIVLRTATNMVLFELHRRAQEVPEISSLAQGILNKYLGTSTGPLGYRALSDQELIAEGEAIITMINASRDLIPCNHQPLGWVGTRFEGNWVEITGFEDAFTFFQEVNQ